MSYVDECQKIINELVGETVKATEDYIQTVLQAPDKEDLTKLIAERQIKAMIAAEKAAGIGAMD